MSKSALSFVLLLVLAFPCCTGSPERMEEAKPDNKLMHLVFLQLNDSLSEENITAFEAAVGQLGAIETVHGFYLGRRAATPDPRARIDYSHVLQMAFRSEADLQAYQQDERHLRIRQELMPLLAGPPVVCDYWVGE